MEFRKFFDQCEFELFAYGFSNWDYYKMKYQGKVCYIVSLAKPGSGAGDSFFTQGDEQNFIRYAERLNNDGIRFNYQIA